jgi:ketosteroid isomerase-like protein
MRGLAVLILPVLFSVASATSAFPQAEDLEAKIRRLDLEAAKAIQAKDERAIKRFFTANSVTNNPRNGLTRGSSGVIDAARSNLIDYHSFERNIESIQLLGDTAIVMGNEIVVFRAKDGGPGETVRRRYTNIWMAHGKEWVIVARHANIICPQLAK